MVTSNQVRHSVTIALALILLLGGVCSGLCFGQTPGGGASHSCCHHGQNHCGHTGPSIDGNAAVPIASVTPVALVVPVIGQSFAAVPFESASAPQFTQFSPPLRSSVLRL